MVAKRSHVSINGLSFTCVLNINCNAMVYAEVYNSNIFHIGASFNCCRIRSHNLDLKLILKKLTIIGGLNTQISKKKKKAYYHVDGEFLDKVLGKKGFGWKWRFWTWRYLDSEIFLPHQRQIER